MKRGRDDDDDDDERSSDMGDRNRKRRKVFHTTQGGMAPTNDDPNDPSQGYVERDGAYSHPPRQPMLVPQNYVLNDAGSNQVYQSGFSAFVPQKFPPQPLVIVPPAIGGSNFTPTEHLIPAIVNGSQSIPVNSTEPEIITTTAVFLGEDNEIIERPLEEIDLHENVDDEQSMDYLTREVINNAIRDDGLSIEEEYGGVVYIIRSFFRHSCFIVYNCCWVVHLRFILDFSWAYIIYHISFNIIYFLCTEYIFSLRTSVVKRQLGEMFALSRMGGWNLTRIVYLLLHINLFAWLVISLRADQMSFNYTYDWLTKKTFNFFWNEGEPWFDEMLFHWKTLEVKQLIQYVVLSGLGGLFKVTLLLAIGSFVTTYFVRFLAILVDFINFVKEVAGQVLNVGFITSLRRHEAIFRKIVLVLVIVFMFFIFKRLLETGDDVAGDIFNQFLQIPSALFACYVLADCINVFLRSHPRFETIHGVVKEWDEIRLLVISQTERLIDENTPEWKLRVILSLLNVMTVLGVSVGAVVQCVFLFFFLYNQYVFYGPWRLFRGAILKYLCGFKSTPFYSNTFFSKT